MRVALLVELSPEQESEMEQYLLPKEQRWPRRCCDTEVDLARQVIIADLCG
jgi:hypothetical protein